MTKSFEIIRPKTHDEWLSIRRGGIGSSEVATILGVNQYDTPYRLWLRKRGEEQPEEENFLMKAGHYLEPAVAQFFADETGAVIQKNSAGDFIVRDTENPFMQVSPDRYFRIGGGDKRILECKTTQRSVDEDDIPRYWYLQTIYQLGVNRIEKGAIAWLTQGREFGYKCIDFDPELFAFIKEKVCEFWRRNIIDGIEPDMTDADDVKLKYKHSDGTEIVADIDMMEDIYQLKRAKVDKKNAEDIVKEYEDKIKKAMGASDKVVNNMGDTLLTWKESTRTTFDEKRFSLDYPDIYTKYLVNTKVSRTFRVR